MYVKYCHQEGKNFRYFLDIETLILLVSITIKIMFMTRIIVYSKYLAKRLGFHILRRTLTNQTITCGKYICRYTVKYLACLRGKERCV